MNAIELLCILTSCGARATLKDGKLTLKVPMEATTPELRAWITQFKPELQHIRCLIERAYPEGVPAQVPLDVCSLCGWIWPGVLCVGTNGVEFLLCVGCYAKEIQSGVDRGRCEACEQTIDGRHFRTDPGGPVVCAGCWTRTQSHSTHEKEESK